MSTICFSITFLYQHFKRTDHSQNNVVQPVENLSYDENSSMRFNTIKSLEIGLKWIKLLQGCLRLAIDIWSRCSKMPYIFLTILAHLSRRYSIPVEPASVRPLVCALTLPNMNISATSGPIATKFYLKHHWGGGKAAICFWPDRIGPLLPLQRIAPIGL